MENTEIITIGKYTIKTNKNLKVFQVLKIQEALESYVDKREKKDNSWVNDFAITLIDTFCLEIYEGDKILNTNNSKVSEYVLNLDSSEGLDLFNELRELCFKKNNELLEKKSLSQENSQK